MKEDNKKNKISTKLTWLIGLISGVLLAFLIIFAVFSYRGVKLIGNDSYQYYQGLNKRYGKFYMLEKIIDKKALKKVDKQDLDQEIIPYLMEPLDDDYASYFTKKEYEEFERRYLESYAGIGVLIKEEEGKLYIVDVIKESPAEKAGIPIGSIIKKVDGKEASGIDKTSERIRGKIGTKVKLTCEYNGKIKKYTLKRDNIDDSGVESRIYDEADKIGYIKLSGFKEGTAKAFKKDIEKLKKDGCKKLIIDLRGNTGGIMQEGIDCADILLPKSKIIEVKERDGKKKVYSSDEKNIGIECVLAVDEYTASASEIFAYAIKDNGRAKLVGSKTFGKGVIQGIYDLGDGSKVKLTIAEYFSPKGTKINGIGIEPDVKCDKAGDECLNKCREVLLGS